MPYKQQHEGILQELGQGCGDVISHDDCGTYQRLSGHDRFTVTQHNLIRAHQPVTLLLRQGSDCTFYFCWQPVPAYPGPPHHTPEPHPEEWEVTGIHTTAWG